MTKTFRGYDYKEQVKLEWKALNRLSEGNKKLAHNKEDNTRFLIWNLPAITTCPYATKLCMQNCYARKAEKQYPQVLPSRTHNYELTLKDNFVEYMVNNISYKMSLPKYGNANMVYFRIHESGDFYSREYFNKWAMIAEIIEQKYDNIRFLAYTKSIDFVPHRKELPSNLLVRFSVWADTFRTNVNEANKKGLPIYTAFHKTEIDNKVEKEDYIKCECDCVTCKKCYYASARKLAVTIH